MSLNPEDRVKAQLPPDVKVYRISHPIIFLGIITAKLAMGAAIAMALWDKDPLMAMALLMTYVVFLK